ncbi:MAG: hypothetical protein ACREGG_00785 [Candidatus Saccharimonadales bacterium]
MADHEPAYFSFCSVVSRLTTRKATDIDFQNIVIWMRRFRRERLSIDSRSTSY